MSKRITLTDDQIRFLINHLKETIVFSGVKQSQVRRGFAIRILNELGDDYNERVDHSSSAEIINAKIASGEIKFPRVS
jgi:hypothetical protein